jgi:hypothetical protein
MGGIHRLEVVRLLETADELTAEQIDEPNEGVVRPPDDEILDGLERLERIVLAVSQRRSPTREPWSYPAHTGLTCGRSATSNLHGRCAPRRAAFSLYLVPVSVVRRIVKSVRLLARDGGLPRPLRWLAALGLAPIPGPFDEAVLLVVAVILWLGYRERLRAAWQDAREGGGDG